MQPLFQKNTVSQLRELNLSQSDLELLNHFENPRVPELVKVENNFSDKFFLDRVLKLIKNNLLVCVNIPNFDYYGYLEEQFQKYHRIFREIMLNNEDVDPWTRNEFLNNIDQYSFENDNAGATFQDLVAHFSDYKTEEEVDNILYILNCQGWIYLPTPNTFKRCPNKLSLLPLEVV